MTALELADSAQQLHTALHPCMHSVMASQPVTADGCSVAQGEMSATVMYFPQQYTDLLPGLRARITATRPSSYASNVRMGVSLNFDKLCACVLQVCLIHRLCAGACAPASSQCITHGSMQALAVQTIGHHLVQQSAIACLCDEQHSLLLTLCGPVQDLVDPSQYLTLYPAAFAPLKPQFDLEAIQDLFNAVDFIGISSYPSLTPNFELSQIESATYQFVEEISSFGVDIVDLIFNKVSSWQHVVETPSHVLVVCSVHPACHLGVKLVMRGANFAITKATPPSGPTTCVLSCANLPACAGQEAVLERVRRGRWHQPKWRGEGHDRC